MARFDHTSAAVADSYARTLLELSEEAGVSDQFQTEFRGFVSLIAKDASFRRFMTSSAVDADKRRKALERHFRGRQSDLLLNTLQVINRKGRCELLPEIFERYRLALEELRHEVDVHVTTAVALSGALRERIGEVATRISGRTARLVEVVDPSILGGLILRIGTEKIDASVARRLHRLRRALHDRASREIHSGRHYSD